MRGAGVAQAAGRLHEAYLAWKPPRKRERPPTAQQGAHVGFFGNGNNSTIHAADRSAQRAVRTAALWLAARAACVRWAR
jgi:hypothetical protein